MILKTLSGNTKNNTAQSRSLSSGDQKFCNSRRWRKTSVDYRKEKPLCENCLNKDRATPSHVTDHIIPESQGGSKFDPDNHMALCDSRGGSSWKCHDRKRGMEKNQPIVAYKENKDGELIPINREDVFNVLP